jgi:hypothetical protein
LYSDSFHHHWQTQHVIRLIGLPFIPCKPYLHGNAPFHALQFLVACFSHSFDEWMVHNFWYLNQ